MADLLAITEQYGLDGIDIDWEYWTYQKEFARAGRDPAESPLLTEFMAKIRAALPRSIALTTDIAVGSWQGPQYEPALSAHAQQINLMAYDATGPWISSAIGHHETIEFVRASLNQALASGFDPKDLSLGIGAYGFVFPNGHNNGTRSENYRDTIARLRADPARLGRALETGRDGDLYFETPNMVAQKVQLALDANIASIFFWEVTQDDKDRQYSLIHAAKRALGNRTCKG